MFEVNDTTGERVIYVVPLATRVLAVAVCKIIDGRPVDWNAHIDAVEGKKHDDEWAAVASEGQGMSLALARHLFPHVEKEGYTWGGMKP